MMFIMKDNKQLTDRPSDIFDFGPSLEQDGADLLTVIL